MPDNRGEHVLVSDVDGTLVGDGGPTAGLDTLRMTLEAHRLAIRLVYATGRSFGSVWSLVVDDVLPEPDAIVSSVGTEIWLPPWKEREPGFAGRIAAGWDREAVLDVAGLFSDLTLQPGRFQGGVKVSFFLDDERTVHAFGGELRALGIRARLVYSGGRFLDALPERAGKRNAIEHLLGLWGLERPRVMACGDSLNDLDMIGCPRFLGVIVGNAEDGLGAEICHPPVYESRLPHAAGVLEGAEVFGFWPRGRDVERSRIPARRAEWACGAPSGPEP